MAATRPDRPDPASERSQTPSRRSPDHGFYLLLVLALAFVIWRLAFG